MSTPTTPSRALPWVVSGAALLTVAAVAVALAVWVLRPVQDNGRWYSAPDREVDGQTGALTELPADEYTATVSRTGPRLTISIEGRTLPLRDDGRCID